MTPILAKFPFSPDPTAEASVAEVTALLAPGTGAIWAFQQERLAPFLEKQGGKWVAKPVGNVALSATFVEFFARAAQVSDALFPDNAPTPTLRWMARGITSAQTPLIVLKHGGREARFDAKTPRNEIVWPAESGRDARLEATFKKNKPVTVASGTGEWALFRLVAQASRFEGAGRAEWNATGKDAVPVVVEFDAPGGLPVLKRGWLGGMTCVAQVTQ
jgi:type VI secretion system protein ImpL